MSKAIEEAAKDFVANYYELEEYGDEISDVEIDNSEECFIAGAEHVFSLPLSQRLTDEERERVRKMYDNAMEVFCDTRDIEAKEYAMCRLNTLEAIFGKELFGEGEG